MDVDKWVSHGVKVSMNAFCCHRLLFCQVERLITERRSLFEQRRQEELNQYSQKDDMDKISHEIVLEEKRKLLREFGADLQDFLPAGTLSEEDFR